MIQKPGYSKVFEGKQRQQASARAQQFLAGQAQQVQQQFLQGRQSKQADYEKRLAAWKKDNAARQAKKQQKKEKKVLGLF